MDVTEDSEKHSGIWGMFMFSTLQSSVFMGKNYSDNWHSIENTKDLTMKQMFDISEKLVSEQSDEINGVKTIALHGSTKVYVFSDSVLCLGKMNEHPRSNTAWEKRLEWFKSSLEYRTLDRIDGGPIEFVSRIHYVAAQSRSARVTVEINETPQKFTGRIILMSMFNDISWGSRDNKKECESNAQLVSLFAKRFGAGQWSFLGPGSEKKWYSIGEDSPQEEWDKMAVKMMVTLAESGHPVFRATSPLSRGQLKSKGGGKLSIHCCADLETTKLFFAQLLM